MNPLTNVKNLQKLNQRELELGLTTGKSWHDKYRDSAWIFIGGLPYDLTEGDVICIFSQYGEIVNINLVRDPKTGKSKGFCFLCYEDQRSTVLTVDNLNGAKVLGRVLRVDHVEEYKKPKEHGDEDDMTMKLRAEGCAPKVESSEEREEEEEEEDPMPVKVKKEKKVNKEKKNKKKRARSPSSSSEDSSSDMYEDVKVKREKYDPGYDKALKGGNTRGEFERQRRDNVQRGDSDPTASRRERQSDKYSRDSERSFDRESNRNVRDRRDSSDDRDRRADKFRDHGRDPDNRRDRERDRMTNDSRRDRDSYDRRDRANYNKQDMETFDRKDREGHDRRERESYRQDNYGRRDRDSDRRNDRDRYRR